MHGGAHSSALTAGTQTLTRSNNAQQPRREATPMAIGGQVSEQAVAFHTMECYLAIKQIQA